MKGSYEGEAEETHGITLLTIDDQNLVSRTEVFRCSILGLHLPPAGSQPY